MSQVLLCPSNPVKAYPPQEKSPWYQCFTEQCISRLSLPTQHWLQPVTIHGGHPAPKFALLTCSVVLWSEKGELKKVVTMLMTISVTYFSKTESACFLSLVLLQAWNTTGRLRHYTKTCMSAVRLRVLRPCLLN